MGDCLPLPDIGIDLSAFEPNHWLKTYLDYAHAISPMTPDIFHESAGLWLASTVIARRLCLPMSFGNIYPNLFIIWLAPTTLYNKTTGLNIARGIAQKSFPFLLAPQNSTPESFLSDMAGREPTNFEDMSDQEKILWRQERDFCSQKGLVLDEISGLMAGARREYNAGLMEAFLRFYDCDPLYVRSTRSQGRVTVQNSYLSLIGASTPASMIDYLKDEHLWSMGWWPRFAILLAAEAKDVQWQRSISVPEPPEIPQTLLDIHHRLPITKWPDPPVDLDIIFADGVFDIWESYNKIVRYDMLVGDNDLDEILYGTYGRSQIQALKVAAILAALDWKSGDVVITMQHLTQAISIAEKWRHSAHNTVNTIRADDFSRIEKRIIRQCSIHHPRGMSIRELYLQMHDKSPKDIEIAVEQLIRMNVLESVQITGKVGRPTTRFKLAAFGEA